MKKTRFLIRALATAIAASMAMTPVTACAEGMQEVNAEDQDRKADLGDVRADGEKEDAVEIRANGHKAEVTTGNLESLDRNGLFTYAEYNAEIDVDVNGDINTPAEISPEDDRSASGVTTNALWGSKQNINVTGNIVSGDDGITANTSDRYEGEEDDPDAGRQGDFGDSRTDIRVNGNITADATGIEVTASLGGENHIDVIGDVTGYTGGSDNPERDDGVIWANANNLDSRNVITVKGDVTGDRMGVWMFIPYENTGNPENHIVIDGTLSANVAAVLSEVLSDAGKNTLTVWKIETPGYTAVKWEYNEQDEENPFYLVEDEETEKSIQYIIRVNQPDEGATLRATDADGNDLPSETGVDGEKLEYAHEGDIVLLMIDVEDGYSIDAVYGDEGQTVVLYQDDAGHYFIEVPRNGGVSFSVKLSKKQEEEKEEEKEEGKEEEKEEIPEGFIAFEIPLGDGTSVTVLLPKSQPDGKKEDQTGTTAGITDSSLIALINAAPKGGTLELPELSGTGFSASVVNALLVRRDITVSFSTRMNGTLVQIVIPAGEDIEKLAGVDGSISFAALMKYKK